MKNLFITLMLCALLATSIALDPSSCDFFKAVGCTEVLTSAMKQCRSNENIQQCMNIISENKQCINCTCTVLPEYCTKKEGEIVPDGPTNPFTSIKTSESDTHHIDIKKVLLVAVKCDPTLFNTCQDKLKVIGGNCLLDKDKDTLQCMKEGISKTECNECLCKLIPNVCETPEGEDKQKKEKKNLNVSDVLLGGVMQSGLKSESFQNLFKEGKLTDQASALLQNKDLQQRLKQFLGNDQLKDSLKNLISSNTDDVSKVAQTAADNKKINDVLHEFAAESVNKSKEKPADANVLKETKQEKSGCIGHIKNMCQLQFLKLIKSCPASSSNQKDCVNKYLGGKECEICVCHFMKNLC